MIYYCDYAKALERDMRVIGHGALVAYLEMIRHLRSRADARAIVPEEGVLSGLRSLRPNDVVVSTLGPFAFIYHWYRCHSGVPFRIVRDVHTALWSGYLIQEKLCRPSSTESDVVMFQSHYAAEMYGHLFGRSAGTSIVAHPVNLQASQQTLPRRPRRLAYLGRVARYKNFDQALQCACSFMCREPMATFTVAGALRGEFIPDPFATVAGTVPRSVARRLSYVGDLAPSGLSEFFDQVDVLLFPSTASRETLGRVALEAAAHGCSVLSTNHAAGLELFQQGVRCPVAYDSARDFSFSGNERLGEIGIGPWLRMLDGESVPYTPLLGLVRFSWNWFDRILDETAHSNDVEPCQSLPKRIVTDFGTLRAEGDLATATCAFLNSHFPEEAKRWFPGMVAGVGLAARKPFYDYSGFANNMEDFVGLPNAFRISAGEE